MKISLIGMSNCGKTYWSKKLEAVGFKRFGCDDLIEKRLEIELKNAGYCGINDVAKWMGQPYDKQYPQTSKKYLKFEAETLKEIIRNLKDKFDNQDIVIDTTGSVIYHDDEVLKQLTKLSRIIYLDTPDAVIEEMCTLYLKNPKPVYWGKSFQPFKEESLKKSLIRCYPEFLKFRRREYNKLAQIILDYRLLRKPGFNIDDFLKMIQKNDSL